VGRVSDHGRGGTTPSALPGLRLANRACGPVAEQSTFSKRFEEAVGEACESASARQVARRFGLAQSTVRAIDLRYLERWNGQRKKPALHHLGVDEIFLGKKVKFLTVVSNLESGEPLWFGQDRKKETLDEFFQTELSKRQRGRVTAACVDMWAASSASIQQWARTARSYTTSSM
jgi:transposase